jgi:hypothetical protein
MRVCQFRHFGIEKAPGEHPARRREDSLYFIGSLAIVKIGWSRRID